LAAALAVTPAAFGLTTTFTPAAPFAPPAVPTVLDFAGLLVAEAAAAGVRDFDADAAVGFESLSITSLTAAALVAFFVGVGTGGCAFLAFASEAAVGAYRPDESPGVLGREGVLTMVFVSALAFALALRDGVDGA
jgi:hypothetical protein